MVYLVFILFIFAVIILIRNYANKFSLGYASMIIGLILSIIGTVLYVSSTGKYPNSNNWIFYFDYKLYTLLASFNMGYYKSISLINLGRSIFLFAMPVTVYLWTVPLYYVSRKKVTMRLSLWGLYSLFYFWYYHPNTVYTTYINLKDSTYPIWLKRASELFCLLSNVNWIIVLLVLLFSIYWLVRYYYKVSMEIKKRQTLSIIISIGLLTFFWASFFEFGYVGNNINWVYRYIESLYFNDILEISVSSYVVYPIVMLVGTIIMLFLIIKNRTFDTIDFFTEYNIKKNMKDTNKDIRNIFHTIKNTLFAMNVLSQNGMMASEDPVARQYFEKINNLSDHTLLRVEHMLVSTKQVNISAETINIVDVIEEAISRSNIHNSIDLIKQFSVEKVICTVDTYHVTEAIINLLNNASDAVISAKRDQGEIRLELYIDHDWVVLNIKDNGVGIPAKHLKDIFKPFYSTKAPGESWGVGLTYSYNVMKAHSGFLIVKSEEDNFTNMQCLLPAKKGGRKYE